MHSCDRIFRAFIDALDGHHRGMVGAAEVLRALQDTAQCDSTAPAFARVREAIVSQVGDARCKRLVSGDHTPQDESFATAMLLSRHVWVMREAHSALSWRKRLWCRT